MSDPALLELLGVEESTLRLRILPDETVALLSIDEHTVALGPEMLTDFIVSCIRGLNQLVPADPCL